MSRPCWPGLLAAICLAGSATAADASDNSQVERNGGYYLLRENCQKEQKLHLLLWVKSAPPPVHAYVREITALADESVRDIEQMAQDDPRIKLDADPLPEIELKVRAQIQSEKEHDLLLGASGRDFTQALLVSQIEAANYAGNLAKVLAQEESSPARARVLQQLSQRWEKVKAEGFRLLAD